MGTPETDTGNREPKGTPRDTEGTWGHPKGIEELKGALGATGVPWGHLQCHTGVYWCALVPTLIFCW